jgi:hypothetical protein
MALLKNHMDGSSEVSKPCPKMNVSLKRNKIKKSFTPLMGMGAGRIKGKKAIEMA